MGKITKRSNKWYGWRPDLPDHRDHVFTPKLFGRHRKRGVARPKSIDLSTGIGPCYDQGALGSCTGNAIAGVIEYEKKINNLPVFTPSRLQIYYGEREIEGTLAEDSGAEIRDGIKVAATVGVAPEELWPYKVSQFTTKPSDTVLAEAKKHLITEYARVPQTANDILDCLASGTPIVFGFSVYDYFESDEMTASGVLKLPTATETLQGGHAVAAFGYLDEKTILVRNSWGQKWGLPTHDGYFAMPIEYMTNPDLADDLWAIRITT